MKIRKLPAEAVRNLQSGIVITDAVQCVLELVYNSLDAQATAIAVQIDLKNYKIQVIDNGRGISRADLENIGERFMTTKYHTFINSDNFTTYGFKGQAISSLLDVCKSVRIETKTHEDEATSIKLFQGNKALTTMKNVNNSGIGTTVTVEDFMWSIPVRRKRIDEIFDLDEIKTQLKYLAIIHYNVSFTLRNENKCLILFQTQSTSSALLCIENVFGSSFAKALKVVNHQDKNYEVTGFVRKKPQNQNNIQLLYVNKRLIAKGIIHKVVNDAISNYLKEISNASSNSFLDEFIILKNSKRLSSNAFILQIKCPISCYDLFTNLRNSTVEFKNWKKVLTLMKKAIKQAFYINKNYTVSSSIVVKNERKSEDVSKGRKRLGVSLLVNAVKGVSVGRKLNTKINKECKENKDILALSNLKKTDLTIDSLESPIPKKRIKTNLNENDCGMTSKMITALAHNQSFVQFCEWLKKKIENESNAFNFYQTFLKHGQQRENLRSGPFALLNSPVLGRKFVKKRIPKSNDNNLKVAEEKTKPVNRDRTLQNNKNAIKTLYFRERKEGLETNNRQTIWKYFFGDEQSNFDNLGQLEYPSIINDGVFRSKELSKKPNLRKIYHSATTPSQSDLCFSNFMKFRNFPDGFECSSRNQKQLSSENNSPSSSDTWTSHYRNIFMNLAFDQGVLGKGEVVSWMENAIPKNFALGFEMRRNSKQNNAENAFFKPKPVCNVSVQYSDVNDGLSEAVFSPKRKDALVQTEITHGNDFSPKTILNENGEKKSKSFKLDDVSGGNASKIYTHFTESRVSQKGILPKMELESDNISAREIPYPDFWNTSEAEKETNSSLRTTSSSKVTDEFGQNAKRSPLHSSQKVNSEKAKNEDDNDLSKNDLSMQINCLTNSENKTESCSSAIKVSLNNQKSGNKHLTKGIPPKGIEFSLSAPIKPTFYLTERHDFMPKGFSPTFPNSVGAHIATLSPGKKTKIKLTIENAENELLSSVKWQDEITGGISKPTIPDGILAEMRQKAEKNMINYERQIPSALLPNRAIKVHDLLHSFAFTKELLFGVEIIGQLDKKFIVAKMIVPGPKKKELITVFDQHAVDERIKLEELLNGYVLADGKFLSTCLNPTIKCELNASLVQVISCLENELLRLGLICTVVDDKTLLVQAVPGFLADKHAKNKKNKNSLASEVQALIENVLKELTATRGTFSQVPKFFYNFFCSEACHGAIKFNKVLTMEEMSQMINKLKNCNLPFQCAHGRPSVIPIIDLEDLYKVYY